MSLQKGCLLNAKSRLLAGKCPHFPVGRKLQETFQFIGARLLYVLLLWILDACCITTNFNEEGCDDDIGWCRIFITLCSLSRTYTVNNTWSISKFDDTTTLPISLFIKTTQDSYERDDDMIWSENLMTAYFLGGATVQCHFDYVACFSPVERHWWKYVTLWRNEFGMT